jgi:hypothetical protein
MKITRSLLAFAAITFLATGCATGMKHSEVAAKMPGLKDGEGRVYFYRSSSMFGAAVQPDIKMNGEAVGTSQPGGFFFIDRPAGTYQVSAATEVERSLSLSLAPKEVKYVRSSPAFGVLVGRVQFELVEPTQAEKELTDLAYTGKIVK